MCRWAELRPLCDAQWLADVQADTEQQLRTEGAWVGREDLVPPSTEMVAGPAEGEQGQLTAAQLEQLARMISPETAVGQ